MSEVDQKAMLIPAAIKLYACLKCIHCISTRLKEDDSASVMHLRMMSRCLTKTALVMLKSMHLAGRTVKFIKCLLDFEE